MSGRLPWALGFAVAACGAPAEPPPASPTLPVAVKAPVPSKPTPAPTPAAPPAPPRSAFPPPSFSAPVARTAAPGDGQWAPIATGDAPPLMLRAMVHPHAIKPYVAVIVVAIDVSRVAVELVAGTLEPPSTTVPQEKRAGLVPASDRPALLAVFNGGFMAKHGGYGVMIDGDTFLPPKDDACTVALMRGDPGVRIGSWPRLAASASAMRAYRQAPPCLVEDGAVHPAIDAQTRPRKWSASETGAYDVRRSALGLDATGTILFYGLGEFTTPHDLADAMKEAGAVVAAQLDINWSWTRFLRYAKGPSGQPEMIESLVKLKMDKGAYVQRPAERDFFYLKRK